nr:GGDEF domain-containing protein [Leucobacter luti]
MTLAVTGLLAGELIGRFKARLERTSITDPLCDVWNKRGFERLLGPAVTAAQRSGQPLSLLYLDLDDFKRVNDAHGHAAGDRVLQEFARAVRDHSRPQDVFARFGGDEFVLLTIDANAEQALAAGERLRRQIPDPGWSFGVSEWRRGESPEAFISRADLLMLNEKHERKRARS